MEIRIEWYELAERQLKDISDFNVFEVSFGIARKIINRIINSVSKLFINPLAGQEEEILSDYREDFISCRKQLQDIYWKKENLITIASVFDCRQNPEKIKSI